MPYIYSAVKETCETGLPVMRALWLHFPDDPQAVGRADEYLFGRDLLVAPVVEKGATSRTVYLPRGTWYDFWTGEKQEGGREIARRVDLGTMPIYVRAGAVLPTGPVRQYTAEKVDGPLTLTVYPGAGGSGFLYEDDGETFDFRQGAFMHGYRVASPAADSPGDQTGGFGSFDKGGLHGRPADGHALSRWLRHRHLP
jgi:alpha-glucosidase/alpha-D-xyloside xylohydrolase